MIPIFLDTASWLMNTSISSFPMATCFELNQAQEGKARAVPNGKDVFG